jgi:hypothetical protein
MEQPHPNEEAIVSQTRKKPQPQPQQAAGTPAERIAWADAVLTQIGAAREAENERTLSRLEAKVAALLAGLPHSGQPSA